LNETFLKELYPQLPVLYIKAAYVDKPGARAASFYECLFYVTKERGQSLKVNQGKFEHSSL
jgi:hypothetical protein